MSCLCELFRGEWPGADRPLHLKRLPDEVGTARHQGYAADPQDVGDPLTGGYVSPLTMTRVGAMVGEGWAQGDPPYFMQGTPLHAPTDRVTPQFMALAQARGMQVVDIATPNQDWQHNYGYSEIKDTQVPALEGPRYSYSAIDTNDLLDDARARVMGTLR